MEMSLETLLKLADLLDPDDVVERLDLTTTDIVLAFSKLVVQNREKFESELDMVEPPWE